MLLPTHAAILLEPSILRYHRPLVVPALLSSLRCRLPCVAAIPAPPPSPAILALLPSLCHRRPRATAVPALLYCLRCGPPTLSSTSRRLPRVTAVPTLLPSPRHCSPCVAALLALLPSRAPLSLRYCAACVATRPRRRHPRNVNPALPPRVAALPTPPSSPFTMHICCFIIASYCTVNNR